LRVIKARFDQPQSTHHSMCVCELTQTPQIGTAEG
jgi:hypothetical protein